MKAVALTALITLMLAGCETVAYPDYEITEMCLGGYVFVRHKELGHDAEIFQVIGNDGKKVQCQKSERDHENNNASRPAPKRQVQPGRLM